MDQSSLEIEIGSQGADVKKFTVHKFPALKGRDIVLAYPLAMLSQSASLEKNTEAMRKLMCFVSVNGVFLTTDELIDEYVGDWFELIQIEFQALKFNCSFLSELDMIGAVKMSASEFIAKLINEHVKAKAEETSSLFNVG